MTCKLKLACCIGRCSVAPFGPAPSSNAICAATRRDTQLHQRFFLSVFAVEADPRAVLCAHVVLLAVQLLERDLVRVERNADGFRMTRFRRTHLLVRRVVSFHLSALHFRVEHAVEALECADLLECSSKTLQMSDRFRNAPVFCEEAAVRAGYM